MLFKFCYSIVYLATFLFVNKLYAGKEKAEAEAVSLKQELGEALQQRVASEERLTHLDRKSVV